MASTRIMIVEDDGIIATRLQSILTRLGYDILGAVASGEGALQKVSEWRPDLVLMDIYLAGKMNGVETAAQIHTQSDIPVVYLTAYSDDALLQQAKITAPYGYLLKPIQERELYATIEMALYRHELESRLKEHKRRLEEEIAERKRTEEALRAEKAFTETTLNSQRDTFFVFDPSGGKALRWNKAFKEISGYSDEEIASMRAPDDWYSEKDLKRAAAATEKAFQEGQVLVEMSLITKDGRTIPFEYIGSLVENTEGETQYIISIGRDITERKRAEAERERLLAALERRTTQLQTAAEVSHAASGILDPNELIRQVVDMAGERFDLYYAGLFLVDQTGEWTGEADKWAMLQAGTGEAGRRMVEQGHKLEIGGNSMIGWCIDNKQARIALDVGEEAVRFENPLLPETRSELALPLISRGEAIGALTIQSVEEAAFSDEDITVLQTMADQLANAIENARLYSQAQQEIAERKRAEETKQELMYALGERVKALNCLYSISNLIETPDISLAETLQRAVELVSLAWKYSEVACTRVTLGDQEFRTGNFEESIWKQASNIIVHGEQVGAVTVCYLEERPESDVGPFLWEERRLLDAIAEQLGRAVERQVTAERLQHMALYDTLTDLPNRALFTERLERSIQRAKERQDYMFAVLYLDLDRLKVVNDSLGHTAGDQLLATVARRLEACVRPDDTVARFGGDEFAILLDGVRDISEATRTADLIQNKISLPIDLEEREAFTTASIGIASNRIVEYNRPVELLRDADVAMYRAKALGKARYELFDAQMHIQAMTRWQLENDLRRAIEHQEFQVHYQPFVSLSSGRIVGAEALLRWQHSERGFIAPDEFIPLAEETGLIESLGEWVLRTACAQIRALQADGYPHLRIAVNISARQFQNPNLAELVKGTLEETGLAAQALELEITESIVMRDQDRAILNELSNLGARVSLDDFGLGSSLDCLKHLPLNTLKIDQSFASGIPDNEENTVIVAAIIAMAHGLKLRVIAEGVETEGQLAFLYSEQCDEGQGNLFGQSMPAGALTKLLQESSQ